MKNQGLIARRKLANRFFILMSVAAAGFGLVWLALILYLAARWISADRAGALAGAALAAVFPWSARLGVATGHERGTPPRSPTPAT